jgi:hypothetical protein
MAVDLDDLLQHDPDAERHLRMVMWAANGEQGGV